ncbi:MAG: glycosyltransferase family 4 protein [Deltaproteobacteria bacterium]|nr:glycosyltransferase family 4 protein [Deltaproteobacteria bacterium]
MNKDKRKIAFALFQSAQLADGGVNSARVLLSHLNTCSPIIITQRESALTEEFKNKNYPVHLLSTNRIPGTSIWVTGIGEGILDLIRIVSSNIWCVLFLLRHKISTLHCNDILAFLYLGLGAKLVGAKVIFVLRRSFAQGENISWKHKLAFSLANQIITLSAEMGESLREQIKCLNGDKVVPLYSGVDREKFYPVDSYERQEIRHKLGMSCCSINIAYVGTISPRKGQLEFLKQVCPQLRATLPQHKIYFLGAATEDNLSYQEKCLAIRQELQLEENVFFVGEVENIANWYRACDFVVLASQSEGLARAMIEALSVGTPVISFAVSSAREVLRRFRCGLVIEANNYDKLSKAIVDLSKNRVQRTIFRNNALLAAGRLFDAKKQTDIFEGYLKRD